MGINYEYVPAFTGGSASIQATMDGRADISFHCSIKKWFSAINIINVSIPQEFHISASSKTEGKVLTVQALLLFPKVKFVGLL